MASRALRFAPAVAAGLLALLVATAGTAAASGHVAIVNGFPGRTMEVCVNGKEIKSSLKYGQAVVRELGNGPKKLRLRRASPGTCTGSPLGSKGFDVDDGTDVTIVGSRLDPDRVVLFDNAGIPDIGGSSQLIARHMADIGTIGFKYTSADVATPWFPAADEPLQKGQWGGGIVAAGDIFMWWAYQPPKQRAIAGPIQLVVGQDKRHEIILVGTNLRNVRLARFTTPRPD